MIEKLRLNENDVWIVIDPHTENLSDESSHEYFTASYHLLEPVNHAQGILFTDDKLAPCIFNSPVQALAYAQDILLKNTTK